MISEFGGLRDDDADEEEFSFNVSEGRYQYFHFPAGRGLPLLNNSQLEQGAPDMSLDYNDRFASMAQEYNLCCTGIKRYNRSPLLTARYICRE